MPKYDNSPGPGILFFVALFFAGFFGARFIQSLRPENPAETVVEINQCQDCLEQYGQ